MKVNKPLFGKLSRVYWSAQFFFDRRSNVNK